MQREVIVPWIEGQRLAVRRGMTGATGNIYTGLHEFSDMMLLLHFLRQDDTFFDVGANVGSYTVLASGVCGAQSVAFEPDPGTVSHLSHNITLNGLGDLVTVREVALGAETGEVPFTIGLDTVNHVASASDSNVRIVEQRRLDDVAGERQPAMMKVDVEGYEELMFEGADQTLKSPDLNVIELETLTPAIEDQLQGAGFERAYYDPFRRHLARQPVDIAASNALYIRDWDFVQTRVEESRAITILGHSF